MEFPQNVLFRRDNRVATWTNGDQNTIQKLSTVNNLWGGGNIGQLYQPKHARPAWMAGSSKARKESRADGNSFHAAMKPILIVAQCFTVLPAQGITASSPSSLRFHWRSLRVLYSLVGIALVGFMTVFWTGMMFQNGLKLSSINPIVFYGTTMINMILFLKLAKEWPVLVQEIHELETSLQEHYGYCKSYARDISYLTVFILTAALIEHLLAISKGINYSVRCTGGSIESVTVYLRNYYGSQFKYVAYSLWLGLAFFFTDKVATFAWNYMDLFIMVISIMLKLRFQQFNKRMRSMLNEVVPRKVWREVREDFATLATMVETFDGRISKLVLVSFWNNLYFVCLQLYYAIISTRTVEESIYFYSSFGYLLTRFMAVCLCAAAVNDESKGPIPVLYSVPSASYSREVQRFIDHATGENISLTALNFFSLTRSLLLTVAGTIVTYEMIMVQLNTASLTVLVANQTTTENATMNPFCPEQEL